MAIISKKRHVLFVLLAVLAGAPPHWARAFDTPPANREEAIQFHLSAYAGVDPRKLTRDEVDALAAKHDRDHFAEKFTASTTVEHRRALIERILDVLSTTESIDATISPDWVEVEFRGPETVYIVMFETESEAPYGITSLELKDVTSTRRRYKLTADNLVESFDALAKNGFTGVVHVRKDGHVLLDKAYGLANKEFQYPMTRRTVIGIGSTPMDFTLVSILLLEQRGVLSRDDSLDKFFDNVPADKRAITIRHLLTGRSGLPNFFHVEDDWDADIAYIDRKTAEQRLFAQELLFEPGTESSHSHGAYGLLASIIERATGKDYYHFLKENFFDPAEMTRTALNGDSMGLPLSEFAVGQGPMFFGLPNIPPNWGKTSWLVMGSGGMCSSMEDMLKFFALVRSEKVLRSPYNERFNRFGASINGSMRGAYLSHAYRGAENEAIVMSNIDADSRVEGELDDQIRALVPALETFIAN